MSKYAMSVVREIDGKTIDPMLIVEKDGVIALRKYLMNKYKGLAVAIDIWTLDTRWGKYRYGTPIAQMVIQMSTGSFWQPAHLGIAYHVGDDGRLYGKMKATSRWY